MRKNQQAIKLFIVLVFCTAYIYSFSQYGALAFESIQRGNQIFAPGTSIGQFSIVGKDKEEAISFLNQKLADWLQNTDVTLQYKEKTFEIDKQDFIFELKESVLAAKDGQKNPLLVHFKSEKTAALVRLILPYVTEKQINIDKLTTHLELSASALDPGAVKIKLSDFLKVNSIQHNKIIGKSILKPKTVPEDIENITAGLAHIEIPAESSFSLLEYLKKQNLVNTSTSTLNLAASGIYKAILPSNFSILERNIGEELPGFTELGFEAKIGFEKNFDLVFSNPNETSYTIEQIWDGKKLQTYLKGEPLLYEYKVGVRDEQHFKPKTIKQYSPFLTSGQKKIKQEGKKGSIIKTIRETFDNGNLIASQVISEDFYAPQARIEVDALPAGPQTDVNLNVNNNQQKNNAGSSEVDAAQVITDDNPTTDANLLEDQSTNAPQVDEKTRDIQSPGTQDAVKGNSDLWGKTNEQPK